MYGGGFSLLSNYSHTDLNENLSICFRNLNKCLLIKILQWLLILQCRCVMMLVFFFSSRGGVFIANIWRKKKKKFYC